MVSTLEPREIEELRKKLGGAGAAIGEDVINALRREMLEAEVGGCTSRVQLTHSLKPPGFNP